MIITKEALLLVAAQVLDYPKHRKWAIETEEQKFRSHFGCSIDVAVDVWNLIHTDLKHAAQPKHLLWSLVFVKIYATEDVHCRIVSWPDPKTFREYSWYFLGKIASLKEQVIVLDNRFKGIDFLKPPELNCYMSVDCTDAPINEPWPFDKKWYSQKINGPAVKYEVAVCIKTGHIVWINGPFCGSENDGTIFNENLSTLICEDEGVEVDGGYLGNVKMKGPVVANSSKQRKQKSIVRARHETVNSRLKIYNVLNASFRHMGTFQDKDQVLMEKHGICFTAVAVITQLGFNRGEKIYDTEYDISYW
jgi:DDE superfamily endonuclease